MKKIIFFVVALTLFSNFSLAEKFIVGEFYQSTIKNVFNTGYAVSFPPGKWEATDVEIDGRWAYIDFENFKRVLDTTFLEQSGVKDKLKEIKSMLKELKSMLDDGLISQELYDTKSAKLLEEF